MGEHAPCAHAHPPRTHGGSEEHGARHFSRRRGRSLHVLYLNLSGSSFFGPARGPAWLFVESCWVLPRSPRWCVRVGGGLWRVALAPRDPDMPVSLKRTAVSIFFAQLAPVSIFFAQFGRYAFGRMQYKKLRFCLLAKHSLAGPKKHARARRRGGHKGARAAKQGVQRWERYALRIGSHARAQGLHTCEIGFWQLERAKSAFGSPEERNP